MQSSKVICGQVRSIARQCQPSGSKCPQALMPSARRKRDLLSDSWLNTTKPCIPNFSHGNSNCCLLIDHSWVRKSADMNSVASPLSLVVGWWRRASGAAHPCPIHVAASHVFPKPSRKLWLQLLARVSRTIAGHLKGWLRDLAKELSCCRSACTFSCGALKDISPEVGETCYEHNDPNHLIFVPSNSKQPQYFIVCWPCQRQSEPTNPLFIGFEDRQQMWGEPHFEPHNPPQQRWILQCTLCANVFHDCSRLSIWACWKSIVGSRNAILCWVWWLNICTQWLPSPNIYVLFWSSLSSQRSNVMLA